MLLALSELGGDKAPRPDGFLKFFWPIIRGEVMHLFEKFYLKDCIVRSLALIVCEHFSYVMLIQIN